MVVLATQIRGYSIACSSSTHEPLPFARVQGMGLPNRQAKGENGFFDTVPCQSALSVREHDSVEKQGNNRMGGGEISESTLVLAGDSYLLLLR